MSWPEAHFIEPQRRIGAVMALVELILTVCALAQPADCEEQRLAFVDGGSLRQCMASAPPKIAEWSLEHPGRRVVRWRCGYPEVEGTKI
jgi:hypothetical protein